MKKRWGRLAIILSAAFILLVAGALLFLQTPLASRLILEQARKHLLSRYHIDLVASSARINIFSGSATLDDVVVQSTAAKDMPPLFRARRIYANAGVISILRGTIELEELSIASPRIHYYVGPDGRSNLPELPPSSGPAPEYRILEAVVRNGSVRIEEIPRNLDVTLPRWRLTIAFDGKTIAHPINFALEGRGNLRVAEHAAPIESASFHGILRKDSLNLRSLKIAAAGSNLEVSGKVERFSRPELELEARPDLDMNRLGEILALGTPITGRLSGKASIKGTIDDLRIATQLKGTGVSGGPYRNTRFALETLAGLTSDFLTINHLELSSPAGSLSGVAQLSLKGRGANSFAGRLRNLDLKPIARLAGAPFDIASRASGRLSLRWKGEFAIRALKGRAQLELAATRKTPERNVLPLSGAISARIDSGDLSGVLQKISTLGARAAGTFSLRNLKTIDAAIDGGADNLSELTGRLSRFLGENDPTLVGVELAGPLQFRSQISGRVDARNRPLIKVSAQAPHMSAGTIRNLALEAEAAIQGNLTTFESVVALPENASIAARGRVDTGGKTPRLTLDAATDRLPLASVLSALGSKIPAGGMIKAELHVEGATDALSGRASIAGDGLSVHHEPIGSFEAEAKLASGEITSNRFRIVRDPLDSTTNFVDASFSYGIKSGKYAFEVNGKQLRLSAKTLPGGDAVKAPFDLVASGAGLLSDPSMDLKIAAQDVRVQERSFGPLSITASLAAGEIALAAGAPTLNLTSQARIQNRAPYPFTAEMKLENPDLSLLGLKAPHGQPVSGTVDIALKGEGDLEHIEDARGSAEIARLQLQAGTEQVHTEAPITAEYRNRGIEIVNPATLVSGSSRIEISGRAPLRQGDNGALSLKGRIDLEQAARLTRLPEGVAVAGMVDLDIAARGGLDQLRPSGTVTVNNGTLKLPKLAVPLSNIAITAEFRDGALVLERADALLGEGVIALKGEFPLGLLPERLPLARTKGPARFDLDLKALKPEGAGLVPEGVSGLVSLHARGDASRLDLKALNAEIEFGDLGLKINDMALSQKGTSRIVVRDGELAVSRMTLVGDQTSIEASGTAGLLPDSPMRLKVTGDFNAALLTFMDQDVKAAGTVHAEIAALGNRNAPRLSGTVAMTNGRVSLRSPRIVADSLNVQLQLTPTQITVQEFKGTLNGGSLTVSGAAGYRRGNVNDVNLKLTAEDFFLNFPEGLKSASNADLTIASKEEAIVIGGTIRVMESSYRESLELSGQLMSFLSSQKLLEEDNNDYGAASPLLDRVRLDITLRTATPLLVQNNLAKVEASANLRVTGPVRDPAAIGRITLTEGGEIVLNQRKFYINRGSIMLNDQNEIRPELDIQAQTKVESYADKSSDSYSEDYVITVRLTGPPEKLTTTVSSEPQLSEQDAMSMLLTGRLTRTERGGQMQMAQTQALSLLAGQAGEEVTREAREALRLSTFRIDPALVSSQSDPGARLTVGEDITKDLSLAYSMNLTDGGQQIWIAEYDITRRLSTQATKQENNSYRFELRHDLRFGGRSRSNRRQNTRQEAAKFTVGNITFDGKPQVPERTLLDRFKLESGDRYDFQKVQKGLDRLHGLYAGQKRLEADVRLRRETDKDRVNLNLSIDPGPVVDFSFEGMALPSKVREQVEKAWRDAVFDTERIEDSSKVIRRALIDKGFLLPKVAPRVSQEGEKKTVQFLIDAGANYRDVAFEFPGASGIGAGTLNAILDMGELRLDVYDAPRRVADYLRSHYRERGYLQAVVSLPQLQLNSETGTGKVSIPVEEGPQFVIGDLAFVGNAAFGYDQLWSVIPTSAGSFYDPKTLQDSVDVLENTYRGAGYNDAGVAYRVVQDAKAAQAHVTFQVTERRQSIIREIAIEGNQGVSREFIERQLAFKSGDPLDFNRISETRRRLYSTGVFSSVDFQNEEIAAKPEVPESKSKEMRVRLRVRENRPYRVQYGVLFDTERGPGGLVEAQNLNFLGRASLLGARVRYDADLKEGRLYFNQPFVTNNFLKMDASVFALKEDRPGFSANRIGFSIFRERELARKYVIHYGYQYDHVRWNGLPPDPTLFQASDPVARLLATVTRDTRDSILDATRGEFTSHSLEFGPRFLGSEVGFTRYSGQYFRYVPLDRYLGKPTKDKDGKPLSPRFVYAGAMRLGLTSAFGGRDTISPERFFAGGGTTMRGFQQDLLGPTEMVDVLEGSTTKKTERPLGGEALFLFNNEIRFPIAGILQGVGFLDIGNVYRRISDFDFTMRKTAGFGLRVKIKFIPLRFDYGFKLDRRPGESSGEFFFSIGQAF